MWIVAGGSADSIQPGRNFRPGCCHPGQGIPVSEFRVNRRRSDGLQSHCRRRQAARRRRRYLDRREELIARFAHQRTRRRTETRDRPREHWKASR
jgi:hypothetical protein